MKYWSSWKEWVVAERFSWRYVSFIGKEETQEYKFIRWGKVVDHLNFSWQHDVYPLYFLFNIVEKLFLCCALLQLHLPIYLFTCFITCFELFSLKWSGIFNKSIGFNVRFDFFLNFIQDFWVKLYAFCLKYLTTCILNLV